MHYRLQQAIRGEHDNDDIGDEENDEEMEDSLGDAHAVE